MAGPPLVPSHRCHLERAGGPRVSGWSVSGPPGAAPELGTDPSSTCASKARCWCGNRIGDLRAASRVCLDPLWLKR